jgi:cytochrome P450
VHETPLGFFALFRYDDVVRFLRDPALSVEESRAAPTAFDEAIRQAVGPEAAERGSRAMLSRDPPDHTRLRRLVSKAFTPRRIEDLRPRVQALVDDALDTASQLGEFDLIGQLAFPLPFAVISEMLGMPAVDTVQLREWSGTIVRSLEPVVDVGVLQRIYDASERMRDLLLDVIAWKRKEPSDDLLSALIAAEEHGDMLSDEELLEQVMLLYIAGHETTVNLIGNGTLALLHDRAEFERLAADPSLDMSAVDELLRYDSPVQMTRRITLEPVEVRGTPIPEGRFVLLGLASANRDEAHFGADAAAVDLRRPTAGDHVAFGGGHHYCLGAALARLEGSVAIGSLVRRFPRVELAGEPTWNGRINLRGLETLPLAVGSAAQS